MIHEHVLILKEYWIWSEQFEREACEYLGDLNISIFLMFRIVLELKTNTHSDVTQIVLRHLPFEVLSSGSIITSIFYAVLMTTYFQIKPFDSRIPVTCG